ncbi:hypothetical protein HUT03_02750 [Candidatus Liberibacter africanus]|nr:hypothetical protein [Candidatus Liberibacter africanus]QTP63969.1 hypothetical protein HUT03_02750 [Candidatus Liberibacter africanus]
MNNIENITTIWYTIGDMLFYIGSDARRGLLSILNWRSSWLDEDCYDYLF